MFSKKDIHTVAEILSIEPIVTNGLIPISRIDPRLYDTMLSTLEKVISVLTSTPESAYKKMELPKKSWGIRIIHAPLWDAVMEQKNTDGWTYSLLGFLQKRINIVLWLPTLPKQICAFRYWIDPYTTLRNTLDWVQWWKSTEPVKKIWGMFKVDISDFFNSITEEQVKNAWSEILPQIYKWKMTHWVIDILVLLSCFEWRLNQWPSSSPMLSNIVWYQLFEWKYLNRVERTQWKWKNPIWIRYLRYADDIIILAINWTIPENIPEIITWSIEKGGFKIAENKTQLLEDAEAYPILWISLKRDYIPWTGFQFQIWTQRDKNTASELLWFSKEDSIDRIRWMLLFNNRISTLGRSGYHVDEYNWAFSKRVAHALRLQRWVNFLEYRVN